MEVSQMITQGMWGHDSELLQLPHFTRELAKKCQENHGKKIERVFDLVEMKDDERDELLQMSESQLMDIDHFCEGYPYIDLTYDVLGGGNVRAGDNVTLQVTLERDLKGRSEVGPVLAPKYPKDKEEGWWLVVGDIESNQLVAIKRVNLHRKSRIKLDFTAPAEAGTRKYKLYFMCDSYLGCDEEHIFALDVKEWIEANHEDSPAYVMPKSSSMDSHSVKRQGINIDRLQTVNSIADVSTIVDRRQRDVASDNHHPFFQGGQRALGCGGAIIVQLPNLKQYRVWTAGNRSMGGRLILLPLQGWLISLSDLRIEPSCCSSDVKDPHAVMADEFSVLLVSLPLNVIAVRCKWACETSAVKGALNP
ncbi:hypothetical protein T459_32880 [Capsicum annuum]|uniref:SEC63 domain-containing protein n=1 Tax=Capsicum annuum TaxID=4072 RepID=A0A2G2Y0N0_CAPAN|nr:hypothetical protein FXO37_20105 [Capsicum annuum]PHT63303.1 hypothetical protein T459_32880 [Capsicum annuum]